MRDETSGPDGGFVVDLEGFNGPLDLLLALIRDEQLDIYDIPVARICEQFLSRMHELRLNEAAEYLEMAARLIRIKAQMLLPRNQPKIDLGGVGHIGVAANARCGIEFTAKRATGKANIEQGGAGIRHRENTLPVQANRHVRHVAKIHSRMRPSTIERRLRALSGLKNGELARGARMSPANRALSARVSSPISLPK